MTLARKHLSKADAIIVNRVEAAPPSLAVASLLVDRFITVVRYGTPSDLTAWLVEAATSDIAKFTRRLAVDGTATGKNLIECWSNCQTEGQIYRLKTLNRQT